MRPFRKKFNAVLRLTTALAAVPLGNPFPTSTLAIALQERERKTHAKPYIEFYYH